jgi:small subunit ribosomal protein S18
MKSFLKNIDYKNVTELKKFITETAKIAPSRTNGANAGQQRKLSKAIKYARFLALLPYCDTHK